MAISMSALRRALAEMAGEAGYGIRNAYRGDHVMGGMALGGFGGGVTGGVADEMTPGEGTAYGPAGFVAGAALGAAGGGGAKLAHMVANAARGGEHGFSRGLREALAEQAAARGSGRRAVREAETLADAESFGSSIAGRVSRSFADGESPEMVRRVVMSLRGAVTPEQFSQLQRANNLDEVEQTLRAMAYGDDEITLMIGRGFERS